MLSSTYCPVEHPASRVQVSGGSSFSRYQSQSKDKIRQSDKDYTDPVVVSDQGLGTPWHVVTIAEAAVCYSFPECSDNGSRAA